MEILLLIGIVVLLVVLLRMRTMGAELRRLNSEFDAIHDRLDRLEKDDPDREARFDDPGVAAEVGRPSVFSISEEVAEPAPSDSAASWHPSPAPQPREPDSHAESEPFAQDPAEDFGTRALATLKAWFQGEQGVVRVGILVLFVGIALLVKYAADHSHFGPKARLAGSIAFGTVLLGAGWRLRLTRRPFALALQGGGLGILYIASFAASRLLGILEPSAALPILGVLSVSLWALAVFQESLPLASLGAAGGFAAPILLSDGSSAYMGLLVYYAILDLCILGILCLRSWRLLGWMGFAFTLGIGAGAGIMRYRSTDYLGTQILLCAFFLIFSAMAWILARRTGKLDGTLVFGSSVAATALQGILVKDFPDGMAISAAILGTFLALAATATWRTMGQKMLNLSLSWISLGVSLSSLSIPLFFDPHVSCVLWALEGTGLLWLGLRQKSRLSFAGGLVLQGLSGFLFLWYLGEHHRGFPVGALVGAFVLLAAGCIGSILVERMDDGRRFPVAIVLACWGFLWALVGTTTVFHREIDSPSWVAMSFSILVLALAAAGARVAKRWKWQAFQESSPVLSWLPLLPSALLFSNSDPDVLLPLLAAGLAAGWIGLDRLRTASGTGDSWSTPLGRQLPVHAAWLLSLSGFVCARTAAADPDLVDVVVAGAWILWTLPLLWGRDRPLAPFRAVPEAWRGWGFLLVLVPLCGMDLRLFLDPSDLLPGGWIPLVAPADLVGSAVPVVAAFWANRGGPRQAMFVALGLAAAFLHVEILRAFHHWGDVEWSPGELWGSSGIQASLGLLWGVSALLLMRSGHSRSNRSWWRAGAFVLGLTVVKLLFVDLSSAGTVGRIVAFLGVGLLMLVIGWVAPLPAKTSEVKE